jgi:hypothetical protein
MVMNARSLLVISLRIFVITLLIQGCTSKSLNQDNAGQANVMANKQPVIDSSKFAKVKVDHTGRIFLNEKQVSLEELKVAFARLKQSNGVVLYYRENPESEPPAEATLVIQAIIDAKLPVRLSSKPDYSDAVGPEDGSNSAP